LDVGMTAVLESAVPQAVTSERAVLAMCLRSAGVFKQATRALSDRDWYRSTHAQLWQIMRDLDGRGVLVEGGAVSVEAQKTSHDLALLVVELVTSGLDGGSLGYHLEKIEQAAIARELQATLEWAYQRQGDAQGQVDPIAVTEEIVDRLRVVQRMATTVTTEVDVLDLIARVQSKDDFVIPGLLARGDRLIVTAPEGYGKSTFLRQIAGCTAGGIHPFTLEAIEPRRVLVYDAENPRSINHTEYNKLLSFLDVAGVTPARGMLTVEEHGPANLLDGRQAAALYNQVERLQPDLVLIGPLYQLHEENPNDEGPARKLSAVLDRVRAISGGALVTEAHTPHNDGPNPVYRPFGASLWKRWPEFGFCLHPAPAEGSKEQQHIDQQLRNSRFTPWRGQRAVRSWPKHLTMGSRLPWEAY
jgi:AAA domain/DnaB-like helicase N terminal domain